jgi:hypothetical protein
MLDSLSIEQKIAFSALNFGPIWINRLGKEQAEVVAMATVFQSNIESHSDAHNMLVGQILSAAKLPFEQAEALHISSLKSGLQFETLVSFGASEQIDVLLEKQMIKISRRIDLPSLAAILSDGKTKAQAWKAVKVFLLSQR